MSTQALGRTTQLTLRQIAFAFAALVVATCVSADDKKPQKEAPLPTSPGSPGAAAEAKPPVQSNPNESAIRATADAFIKAFNAGDAKAVAALWTPNGTVADDDGNVYRGRKSIEDQYAALFKAHPTARMEVAIKSIDFPTPTTAIEDGVAQVLTRDNSPPSASHYTAVHVQEEGKWLMASVHESADPVSSNYAQLEGLGWIVGDWQAQGKGGTSHHKIRWIANKSFIQRDYSVHRDGMLASSGTQILGWDPRSHQIVSWSFDSSGGYGTGVWTPAADGWLIESRGMTADGVPTSSKDHLICIPGDKNVVGWRSTDRQLGNTKLPDTGELVLDRAPQKPRATATRNSGS
jgi:uncharacterized protein (TIGR02246 family)